MQQLKFSVIYKIPQWILRIFILYKCYMKQNESKYYR